MKLEHGSFNNVFHVPSLASNLLSVYQMTHTSLPKIFTFNRNDVDISEIASRKLIATCIANHFVKTYEFSKFVPNANPTALLTHGNEVSRIWHERFVHLNFKNFQQLQKHSIVEGLPAIKTFSGIFQGCIVSKQPEHKFDRGKAS